MTSPSWEMTVEHLMSGEGTGSNVASLCFFSCSEEEQLMKTTEFLHVEEWQYYRSLHFERRIRSYLAGRYAAKKAIALYTNEDDLRRILIARGIFNQPLVVHSQNAQVSITHSGHLAAAVAFSEKFLMGIDIEQICESNREVLQDQATARELSLIQSLAYSADSMLTLVWTAKEALSKVLKTGLSTPFAIFELKQINLKDDVFVSYYENFYQYETTSFMLDSFVCSITYPKGMRLNMKAIKKGLNIPIQI
ncbi:4'-phosphopantetheinyl transferase family protein [Paenibacillus glucanolyticus]|uniref:4'-phosphopantetheinyl transferase family protein n=1 Tax=Paenibacillus glucanolyticus TaxID=59843 RepID=UPI0036976EA5